VEAVETEAELRTLPGRLSVPQVLNIVVGGKTPTLDQSTLAELGFGLVLYANTALQAAVAGMQVALKALKDTGRMDEDPRMVAPFAERQRLVQKTLFDQLDKKYATKG
jgi:2-methylisocitrate lyase-like PEP mutase family enzyme